MDSFRGLFGPFIEGSTAGSVVSERGDSGGVGSAACAGGSRTRTAPNAQVFVYDRAPKERKVSVWGYLVA